MLRYFLSIILIILFSFAAEATNYYISPTGSDTAIGTSISTAWQTIAKVNTRTFVAGDNILFEGNQIFNGNIYLSPASYGTATNPIVISSYGSGVATINAGNSFGIYAYNNAGISITNLVIAGSGDSVNTGSGISFYTDTPGNISLSSIKINNVEVSGFQLQGITIGAWPLDNSRSGYRDISITNCSIHDNGDAGITMYGYYNATDTLYSIKKGYIRNCYTFNNRGLAGATHNSGNGIVIGQVDSATIEYCESYNNGERNDYASGPAGIWAWDSKHIIIQHCESHHNHSTTTDGDGFDLDGGTSYSIMQYNYSHDNDGAGFLVCQFAGARPNTHNVVRYNISQNDGCKGNNGGIFLYTPTSADTMHHLDIYNNTVYTDTAGVNSRRAFYLLGPSMNHIRVANNIFMAKGNYLLDVHDTADILIVNNAYNDSGGIYRYLGTDYDSLAAFRTATGQEMLDTIPKGIVSNILTHNPGHGGTLTNPTYTYNLFEYYFPIDTSKIVDSGLNLRILWGINVGNVDYDGMHVPWKGRYDIGAWEYSYEGIPGINANNRCNIYPNPATNKITIETPVTSVHITLYDMFGAILYEGVTNSLKTELNLQAYPTGNYILQLSTKDWIENKKLVKY